MGVATEDRRLRAVNTWWCEVGALLFTVLYCVLLGFDLVREREEERLSDASWFSEGFCIQRFFTSEVLNSHDLCFLGDLFGGGWLLWENYKRYRQAPRTSLEVAMLTCLFTVMHGFGHLVIGHAFPRDFMAQFRIPTLSWGWLVGLCIAYCTFLSLGPFLGYCNRVHPAICVTLHILSAFVFLQYVPTQFAFGWILVYLNAWYCAPRVVLVGCESEEDVAFRVDEGWDTISQGFLGLMPVVFAEMLACDRFVVRVGGHFIYDAAIVAIVLFYSRSLWRKTKD